jgi:hypothetical protein
MPRKLDNRLIAEIAEAVVQSSEHFSPQLVTVMRSDPELVRANLIAYAAFNVTFHMARHVDRGDAQRFDDPFLEAVVRLGRLDRLGGIRFLRSRCRGHTEAASAFIGGDQDALADYFQGCCSVNRVEIAYEEVYPNPDELQFRLDNFGGTPAGYAKLGMIRGLSNPATYSNNKSIEVSTYLIANGSGVRAMVAAAMNT